MITVIIVEDEDRYFESIRDYALNAGAPLGVDIVRLGGKKKETSFKGMATTQSIPNQINGEINKSFDQHRRVLLVIDLLISKVELVNYVRDVVWNAADQSRLSLTPVIIYTSHEQSLRLPQSHGLHEIISKIDEGETKATDVLVQAFERWLTYLS